MRGPTRSEFADFGIPVIFFGVVIAIGTLVEDRLTLFVLFLAASIGLFAFVYGWWIYHSGPVSSKIALPTFFVGGLLLAILPLFPLTGPLYGAISLELTLMTFAGFTYVVVHDRDRVKSGKQSALSKENRLMTPGFLLLLGASSAFWALQVLPRLVALPLPMPRQSRRP